jgi:DNA-binding response OmpR family regulator
MPESASAVVLVADSDPGVLKNISSTLEKAGFTVLTARGGPDAAAICAHRQEAIELAIVDSAMAASGDLLECLYGFYPNIRILFTSARDESSAVSQMGRPGRVREFLQKPFRRSQLLGRVLLVLDAPLVGVA